MSYFPSGNFDWEKISSIEGGFNPSRLIDALKLANTFESPWPYDLDTAGSVPGLTDIEKPPYNKALGPYKPRGRNNGCILKSGKIVAQWGDVDRVDMTFSIAKSYLSILTGVAIKDGSEVFFEEDEFSQNQIGLSIYTKFGNTNNKSIASGNINMLKNKQNTSYEGNLVDLSSEMKNLEVNKIKKTKSFQDWLEELKCVDCIMKNF